MTDNDKFQLAAALKLGSMPESSQPQTKHRQRRLAKQGFLRINTAGWYVVTAKGGKALGLIRDDGSVVSPAGH